MRALTNMTSASWEDLAAAGSATAAARNNMLSHVWKPGKRIVVLSQSECRRSVDPQHPGFTAPGILPMMWGGALKIKTVAALQRILLAGERNFQLSAQQKQEFFSFVRIRFAAARLRRDPE